MGLKRLSIKKERRFSLPPIAANTMKNGLHKNSTNGERADLLRLRFGNARSETQRDASPNPTNSLQAAAARDDPTRRDETGRGPFVLGFRAARKPVQPIVPSVSLSSSSSGCASWNSSRQVAIASLQLLTIWSPLLTPKSWKLNKVSISAL